MNDFIREIYHSKNVIDLYSNPSCEYTKITYDFIVVGSGAGGAVVAKELSEIGAKVALIEEGPLPFPFEKSAFRSLLKIYRESGFTGVLGKPMIPIPLGRCVGGTTTINSGTCFRTPQEVFDKWNNELNLSTLVNSNWEYLFTKVEKEIHVEEAKWEVMNKSSHFIKRIFTTHGYECLPLRRNTENCQGCGMCCYVCTSGAKKSMEVSYIPKGIKNGMLLFYNAKVTRISLDSNHKRITGVEVEIVNPSNKKPLGKINIKGGVVIIACGALLTPSLLQKSGIARNNTHLGKHLTIHPASKISIELEEDIYSWVGIPQACYSTALEKEGIIFEGVAMPPDLGPSAIPFIGEELVNYFTNYRKMATFGFMIKDSTEGYLKTHINNQPIYYYQLTESDVSRLKKAITFLSELAMSEKTKKVYAMVSKKPNVFSSLEDIQKFMKTKHSPNDFECMAFHPLGTCRVGTSPENGVCDETLKVFGTENLYICDGSAIPTSLGVNPQLTIMAFATRLATIISKT
ncbi:MAG: GMC family oxidoreductase [Candidatus Hydrogenedentes bacterium]|nr:GMC family oxidoreductase [Candidatus Hydrogenedentota bacterium]